MHYHKCGHQLPNDQVCGQIVGSAEGVSCESCREEQFCSAHHPDPEHRVEPTPPLSRNPQKPI